MFIFRFRVLMRALSGSDDHDPPCQVLITDELESTLRINSPTLVHGTALVHGAPEDEQPFAPPARHPASKRAKTAAVAPAAPEAGLGPTNAGAEAARSTRHVADQVARPINGFVRATALAIAENGTSHRDSALPPPRIPTDHATSAASTADAALRLARAATAAPAHAGASASAAPAAARSGPSVTPAAASAARSKASSYTYTPLQSTTRYLDTKTDVHVYGIVTFWLPPKATNGTDFMVTFKLLDPSWDLDVDGLPFNVFCRELDMCPPFRCIGDIVRVHRCLLQRYQGKPQGFGKIRSGERRWGVGIGEKNHDLMLIR